jgi:hypothetical protein
MSAELAREHVKAGAEWLDGVRPGWAASVDLDALDTMDDRYCPGAQAFGSYDKLVEFADLLVDGSVWKWIETHGFCEHTDWNDLRTVTHYEDLDQAWRDEVLSRRGQG